MPVLPREPGLFPEGLFTEESLPDAGDRRWWVAHTRPRQEKALARQLIARRVPFYLPLVTRRRAWRRRTIASHVPLFAGYLFAWVTAEERATALGTNRILRTLAVADQEGLWRDLHRIERLLASAMEITPEDRLVRGKTVEIRSGPLAGVRGTIVRRASRRRLVVCVDFIQRGASVLVDDFRLAEIPPLPLREGSRDEGRRKAATEAGAACRAAPQVPPGRRDLQTCAHQVPPGRRDLQTCAHRAI